MHLPSFNIIRARVFKQNTKAAPNDQVKQEIILVEEK